MVFKRCHKSPHDEKLNLRIEKIISIYKRFHNLEEPKRSNIKSKKYKKMCIFYDTRANEIISREKNKHVV